MFNNVKKVRVRLFMNALPIYKVQYWGILNICLPYRNYLVNKNDYVIIMK